MPTLQAFLERYEFEVMTLGTSRWRDFHAPLSELSPAFRRLNSWVERAHLGIEIFCLARKR